MRELRLFLICTLIVLIGTHLWAQSNHVSIESKVDRSKITIGDRITYTILVKRGENVQVEFPDFGENLGAFEILDYVEPEAVTEDSLEVLQRDYIISTFDTGEYLIPAVAVNFIVSPDTVVQQLRTEEIKIEVESLKPSEAGDIRDIKTPLEIERDYRRLIRLGIALLCIILLGILVYLFIRKRRGQSLLPMRPKHERPPHEIALDELDDLVRSGIWMDGKVKEYYVRISDVIRKYIRGRYYLDAPEMTTSQLIEMFKIEKIDSEIIDLVAEFLDECDLVKFAKYIPDDEEMQTTTDRAYEIVNRTKIELVAGDDQSHLADDQNASVVQEEVIDKMDDGDSSAVITEEVD